MKNIQSHTIKYGLMVFLGLAIFFLIMESVGLVHNFNLRILNAVIVVGGIYFCLKSFKQNKFDHSFTYINGLGVGFFVALISTISFAVFMGIYLFVNPEFMLAIKENEPQGIYMNEFAVIMLILIEGLASGLLITYSCMQFLKPAIILKSN